MAVKTSLTNTNQVPEWIINLRYESRIKERYDRVQATEYIKQKVGFSWPSDMLEILARSRNGPQYQRDYMSGDLSYRLNDIDEWLRCYFPGPIPADEPSFKTAKFPAQHPARWLYASDVGYFTQTLCEHLDWWCCDVIEVSTALGAAMCAGNDIDAAILELNSNFDATIVICEILKQREIPAIVIVRDVDDIPSAISKSAYVLQDAYCMRDIEGAIIKHVRWPLCHRMRMSGVLDEY